METGSKVQYSIDPDALGIIVVALNSDFRIDFINAEGCKVLQCRLEDALGKDWFGLFVPEGERKNAEAAFRAPAKEMDEPSAEIEAQARSAKGKEIVVRWRVRAITDGNGSVGSFICTGEDITGKISEEKRLALINERIGDVISLYSAEGIITYVSPSVFHILGYRPEEIIGENIISFTHPEDAAGVLERHHTLLRRPLRTVRSEHRVKNKQGKWIWVEGVARNMLKDPHLSSILCNFRDISEQRAAKEALEKSEEKYRTLVNAMAEAVVQIDLTGNTVFVNRAYCELTGYKEEELIGQNCLTLLVPEEDLPRVQQELANNSKGSTDHYEIRLVRKSGQPIWISANSSPILDSDKKIAGILSTMTDITQRRMAAKQIEEMNKEMTEFFYKSSHDLKGPISSVSGLLELARMDIKDPMAARYIDMMEQAVSKLKTTVQQVLETIKVRDIVTEPGPIDFKRIIEDVANSLNHMPGIDDLHIDTEITVSRSFCSDINIVYSILQNLIENAAKYRDTSKARSWLRLMIRDDGNGVSIVAEDNGIGMSRQVQKRVFDMFFRAHIGSEGTGLGLYIVKKGIEKLEGTIDVTSEEGKGSCFTIFLPGMQEEDKAGKMVPADSMNHESR